MNVCIYGKLVDENICSTVEQLIRSLKNYNFKVFFEKEFFEELSGHINLNSTSPFLSKQELQEQTHFLISVGGDGTFLNTIHLVEDKDIKIIGINAGRLGFLSATSTEQIEKAIKALHDEKYSIEKRSLLCLMDNQELFGEHHFALNEISVQKRDTSSMISVEVIIDGVHLNTYWTDGLIISTATGSTAYSLSCGGPILMPGSGNLVITPIAPHNLNVRPIVIDEESTLELFVEGRSESNLIALDSRSQELLNGKKVTIKKASHKIQIIQLEENSFIQSLKNKLNWGLDRRNK